MLPFEAKWQHRKSGSKYVKTDTWSHFVISGK